MKGYAELQYEASGLANEYIRASNKNNKYYDLDYQSDVWLAHLRAQEALDDLKDY